MAGKTPSIAEKIPAIPVDPKVLNRWVSAKEAAAFRGDSSPDVLRLQRYRGTGTRYSRQGRVIKYWLADVHADLCRNLRGGSA